MCLLVRVEESLDPRPLPDERLVLEQELGEQIWLVQARHQTGLDRLAREVDKKLEDRGTKSGVKSVSSPRRHV